MPGREPENDSGAHCAVESVLGFPRIGARLGLNAERTVAMDDAAGLKARTEAPDLAAMRRYRLGRLLREIEARDVAGALFFDPVNIRYATDCSNMQVWTLNNPARYALVLAGGRVILWEFHGAEHLSDDLPLIAETRVGTPWFHFAAGDDGLRKAREFAGEIAAEIRGHCDGNLTDPSTSRRCALAGRRLGGRKIKQGESRSAFRVMFRTKIRCSGHVRPTHEDWALPVLRSFFVSPTHFYRNQLQTRMKLDRNQSASAG